MPGSGNLYKSISLPSRILHDSHPVYGILMIQDGSDGAADAAEGSADEPTAMSVTLRTRKKMRRFLRAAAVFI